jgi:ribonuclease Z
VHDALTSVEYKNWMSKFGNSTEHIIINKDVCAHNYVFCSTSENQYKLNHINNQFFPLPHISPSSQPIPDGLPMRTHVGENLMQLHFAPLAKQGIDKSEVLKSDTTSCRDAIAELYKVSGFTELFEQYKITNTKAEDTQGPLLVFLGTGSAIPSKYRNVTCMYFEPVAQCGILLDAGEGSYGQLYRRFGSRLDEVVKNLKLVWISHIHADHHLGLIKFLTKRQEFTTAPLLVIAPRLVGRWLAEYNQIQLLNYEFVDCTEVLTPENKLKNIMFEMFGFTSFFNIEVLHCPEAFGVIITHNDGWKLVYSGDTQPCPALELAGANATLLIHEATLEEGMEADALEKGHSTTTQAITSGLKMGADAILLTHFSQRYPKIPTLETEHKKVSVAFDLMSVTWSQLHQLPSVVPLLSYVFEKQRMESEKTKEKNREKMAEEKKIRKINKKN